MGAEIEEAREGKREENVFEGGRCDRNFCPQGKSAELMFFESERTGLFDRERERDTRRLELLDRERERDTRRLELRSDLLA